MFGSTNFSFPTLFAAIQLQTMNKIFRLQFFIFVFHHSRKKLYLLASINFTFNQKSVGLSIYFWSYSNRCFLLFSRINDFFRLQKLFFLKNTCNNIVVTFQGISYFYGASPRIFIHNIFYISAFPWGNFKRNIRCLYNFLCCHIDFKYIGVANA